MQTRRMGAFLWAGSCRQLFTVDEVKRNGVRVLACVPSRGVHRGLPALMGSGGPLLRTFLRED